LRQCLITFSDKKQVIINIFTQVILCGPYNKVYFIRRVNLFFYNKSSKAYTQTLEQTRGYISCETSIHRCSYWSFNITLFCHGQMKVWWPLISNEIQKVYNRFRFVEFVLLLNQKTFKDIYALYPFTNVNIRSLRANWTTTITRLEFCTDIILFFIDMDREERRKVMNRNFIKLY